MNWLFKLDFKPENIRKTENVAIDVCCDKKMQITKDNSIKRLICMSCGRYRDTTDTFEVVKENVENLKFTEEIYGFKSGETYIAKIKNDLFQHIRKATKTCSLKEAEVMEIMDVILKFREELIPRGKRRIGLIAATVHYKTGISKEKLCIIYDIEESYITQGIKLYAKIMAPYEKKTIEDFVDAAIKDYPPVLKDRRETFLELIKLSRALYISNDLTFKTKCAGIAMLLSVVEPVSVVNLPVAVGVGKGTICKFYDQIVVYLNAVDTRPQLVDPARFQNRRIQLIRYFKRKNWSLIPMERRGRFAKYFLEYEF